MHRQADTHILIVDDTLTHTCGKAMTMKMEATERCLSRKPPAGAHRGYKNECDSKCECECDCECEYLSLFAYKCRGS